MRSARLSFGPRGRRCTTRRGDDRLDLPAAGAQSVLVNAAGGFDDVAAPWRPP
jgi:hypothetical protein